MTMGQDQSTIFESLQAEETLTQSRINEIASQRQTEQARNYRIEYEARRRREEIIRQKQAEEELRQRLINEARRQREADEARQRQINEARQRLINEARRENEAIDARQREANNLIRQRQRQTARITRPLDCTCSMCINFKSCKRCTLSFCGQCTSYQYLWLSTDMCNSCVIMAFIEEMSREDLYTLNFKQLKTYLRNYDIPFLGSHNKLELVDNIITSRPLNNEQRKNYNEKRLREWMQQLNRLGSGGDNVATLKRLERFQQERFQLYMMKKEERLSPAEYDSAIKNIPLKMTIPTTSLLSTSSASSSAPPSSSPLVNQQHSTISSTHNRRKNDNNNNRNVPSSSSSNNKGKQKATNNNNNNNNNTVSSSSSSNNNKNNHNNNKGKQKSTKNNNNNNNNNVTSSSPNNKKNNHHNNNSRNKGKQKVTNNNNYNNNDSDNISMENNTPAPSKDEEDKTCKICFDAERSCAFVECGHVLSCYECGLKLLETSSLCPICRSFIVKVVKLFIA
ncbi:unnamed protein product [Cunninghamella echinulata]